MKVENYPLGDLIQVLSGFAFKSSQFNVHKNGIPIIRIRDVKRGYSDTYFQGKYDSKYLIKRGDYLVGMDGEFNIAQWKSDDALLNQRVCKISTKDSAVLDIDYLGRFLALELKRIEDRTSFVTVKHLSVKTINNISIPLPPLEHQKFIADVLDKASNLKEKRQRSIQYLDGLLYSSFLEKFGNPMTNSKGLDTIPLFEVGKIQTGNTPSRKVPSYYGGSVEWIKSDNINTPFHFLTKAEESLSQEGKTVARLVPENSILVTCIAGSPDCIGNVAMADREVAFNQQINSLTPYNPDTVEFWYTQFLVGKDLVQKASTNSMKGMVNKTAFSNVEFLNPSLEQQKEFSEMFQNIKKQKDTLLASQNNIENLFHSLQQRAFKGELIPSDLKKLESLS